MQNLRPLGAGFDIGARALREGSGLGGVQAIGHMGVAVVSTSVRIAALALLLAGTAAPLLVVLGAVLLSGVLGAWWAVAVVATVLACAAIIVRRVSVGGWFDLRWPDELPGTVVLRDAGMVCLTAAGTWTVRWVDVARLRLYSFPWFWRGVGRVTRVEVYLRTRGGSRLELRYDTLPAGGTTWPEPVAVRDVFGEVLQDRIADVADGS